MNHWTLYKGPKIAPYWLNKANQKVWAYHKGKAIRPVDEGDIALHAATSKAVHF